MKEATNPDQWSSGFVAKVGLGTGSAGFPDVDVATSEIGTLNLAEIILISSIIKDMLSFSDFLKTDQKKPVRIAPIP